MTSQETQTGQRPSADDQFETMLERASLETETRIENRSRATAEDLTAAYDPVAEYEAAHGKGKDFQFYNRGILQASDPLPGMDQRWIRYQNKDGSYDTTNIAKMKRAGWVPRPVKTVDTSLFTAQDMGELGMVVVADGLVLCHRPAYMTAEAQKQLDQRKRRQTSSVMSAAKSAETDAAKATGMNLSIEDKFTEKRGSVAAD